MLSDQMFWTGVVVGVVGTWGYHRYVKGRTGGQGKKA